MSYSCPFNPAFPDYSLNFQPCNGSGTGTGATSATTNVAGFPCTRFSITNNVCIQCFTGYALSSTGTCLYNTTCPPRQYYSFGICYPVNINCGSFDVFTGACLNCTDPLRYVVNGSCIINPALVVNCTARQYKVNNRCFDVSPLCGNFDPNTGGCTSCIAGYDLAVASGTCFPRTVTCTSTQYNNNGVCTDIPANCVSFDAVSRKCTNCSFGFYLNNGVCAKINCEVGKVPSKYGIFCIDVPPACNLAGFYDDLTGDCLKC